MKIVWCSNMHLQPTGYATICRHVVPHVQNNSHHEMVEFAISGISRVLPFEWKGIKVYGVTGHGGKFGMGDWPTVQALEKPDVWLLNFDAWAAGPVIAQMGIKYAIYPPIDHDPLPPVWLDSLKGAYEIVPYCKFGKRVMREGLGMVYPIMDPIPHGVDTKIFRPMEVSKTKAFGRETPQDSFVVGICKNNQGTRAKYELQLEGFRMFLDRIGDDSPRLYLHTSKTGNQAFDIAELVRRFNLSGHVYLVGPGRYRYGLSDEELAVTYNACDVLLNAVAGEGWGLPITEAFACGKPVIATAFSSMPELLTGVEGETEKKVWDQGECIEVERGWLVPTSGSEFTLGKRSRRRVFRAEDVAAALTEAYEHPEKRKVMGEAAHKWVRALDWKQVGNQWIEYLDGLEKRIMPRKYSWKPIETEPMGNKTACVIFSFNRPDYLVKTLDSLSKNTKADECDWYFYQDGWKNDPKYPYLSEKDEVECHKRVQQCVEILGNFPFKHKEIITKEYNVCIGRQREEAKAHLFEQYDHVIFFDDDHVVSKDYIDILLKLHEQFPDAVVGAQATESRNISPNATLDEVGVTVKQTEQTEVRPGRWRWLGYLLPKAVHEVMVEEMNKYMEFIGPSYRNIPHAAVKVKYGVQVTGADGMMDKILDRHGIKRIATVIPRGKYIGEVGLFTDSRLHKAMGWGCNPRYEFDESEVKEFKVREAKVKEMPRDSLERKGLDKYANHVFSQNGEDGIIEYIFSKIGYESRRFLEFGFGMPECNCWRLMVKENFGGVFIDGQPKICEKFNKEHSPGKVKALNVLLTKENIEDVVASSGLSKKIDLLSIDADGNDYWLWQAINRVSPRLVVIEYNSGLGPSRSCTVPYDPLFERHAKHESGRYFGASLTALQRLGERKGYRLVGCDPAGVNAFFLRDNVDAPEIETLIPQKAFRPGRVSVEEQTKMLEGMTWEEIRR